MFAKPRPKKSPLPPPSKKRKTTFAIEEISFDNDARQEYLTGFHKRKLQRKKHAQEEAAKRAHQEKLDMRKQIREERRREVEEHVESVNRMLRESGAVVPEIEQESADEEWDGFPDKPDLEIVDHEEEYIDEDRYTTVTVESVSVSRDGLDRPELPGNEDEEKEEGDDKKAEADSSKTGDAPKPKKPKKKKFRYETKFERDLTKKEGMFDERRRPHSIIDTPRNTGFPLQEGDTQHASTTLFIVQASLETVPNHVLLPRACISIVKIMRMLLDA
ncbi:Ribosomal RNA-processing protein [Paramyrothecium foliicola]|nr:Ribosomal RNA-processing protein [Paramyrothecium foliicola]